MRLVHANIVPVFDFGRVGDEYFLAMEWVDGVDLARLLEDGPLPRNVAAHVAAEVARALDYAHTLDRDPIVHRDVKPANVLLSRAGDVRLTDFGIATGDGDERRAGTPAYMAPEQAGRKAVDGRADLFALGRMLVEMLVGDLPPREGRLDDWSGFAEIPTALRETVRKLLAVDPALRPSAAREVASELEQLVARARAVGGRSPREELALRVGECARTRIDFVALESSEASGGGPSAAGQDDDPDDVSRELTPEVTFRFEGTDPTFVKRMSEVLRSTEDEIATVGHDPVDLPDDATTIARGKASRRKKVSSRPPPMMAPRSDAMPTLERFGRYDVVAELASGGFARVDLARAEGPGGFEKLVALKRIHPHLARDENMVEMFLDEARIASRVDHPNVCTVFDFGEVDGAYYIAMEHVFGETLWDVLGKLEEDPGLVRDPTWPVIAAHVVAEVCEALHAAHELRDPSGKLLDVVHRDVTPENVFVGYDGHAMLVDFGIARSEGRVHRTRTGVTKGKLGYVSPEVCEKLALDRRADVWSLGVVLWELLAGCELFRRDSDPETILAVIEAPIPLPSSMNANVQKELDDIVMKALARDREARYATARDLGRDLSRFLARREEPLAAAEVSDFVSRVFAPERARKEQLLRDARKRPMVDGSAMRSPRDVDDDPLGISDALRARSRRRWLVRGGLAAVLFATAALVTFAFTADGGAGAPLAEARPPAEAEPAAPSEPEPEPEPASERASASEPAIDSTEGASPLRTSPTAARGALASLDPARPDSDPAASPNPTPRRRPRSGRVSVATPGGWADVYVDGRRVGRVPGTVTVPAGRRRLRILPFGREPAEERVVTVQPNQSTRLVVALQR
jgi:serine/threonine-protein kinase